MANDQNAVEVLLVEDNLADAELIIRSLKKHNLANRIVHLQDGAQALEFLFGTGGLAETTSFFSVPKLVLLDVKLPKVDGIVVLRRIKEDPRTREFPVVMLTSSNQKVDIDAAYKLGTNSFVTKPIKFDEFAKAVADLGIYWVMLNVPPVR